MFILYLSPLKVTTQIFKHRGVSVCSDTAGWKDIFFVADIDECAENLDNCDEITQTCVNSKGSFRCIDRQPTCDFGYRYNENQDTCVGESPRFVNCKF